jgi:hypothetical protein
MMSTIHVIFVVALPGLFDQIDDEHDRQHMHDAGQRGVVSGRDSCAPNAMMAT